MATYTSNYGWTKPSGSDNVDISVLNDNLDGQDSVIHDAFLNMAVPFSELSTYAVDDIVLYGTTTYKCHTAVVTPGSWTGSTNWQVYKLSEGGGGGLTLGETSSTAYRGDRGKTAYDHSQTTGNPHGTTASDVGLGNVPNVSTNDQTPTFTKASTRKNIASGEKLSVIFGKIQKFFNDLKSVAFSGSYNDLSNKPTIPTTASGITYDNTESGLSATDVQGAVDELAESYPANKVMMSDGTTSVEDALDEVAEKMGNMRMAKLWENPNTSINFDAQTIQLSSSNYDLLLIIAQYATTFGNNISNISSGTSGYITFGFASSGGPASYSRIYNVNANQVTFGDCEMNTHSSPSRVTANNTLIPFQIYGIKLA